MATTTLLPNGKQQFFDSNGNPLVGGSVYFYTPATTTPKNTWQDEAQTVLNTNPVVLDIRGEAVIYGSGKYRQIVKDSLGNTIYDVVTASPLTDGFYDNTGFYDSNGNELLLFQVVAAAANFVDLFNAATGTAPVISANGSDTNIDLSLLPKGTGGVTLGGYGSAPRFIPTGSTIPTNGVYLPAANTVGISANSTRVATFAAGASAFTGTLSSTGAMTMNGTPTFNKVNRQVITASGTYTPTAGLVAAFVECQAGGGGGGGAGSALGQAAAGGGGGGGAYASRWLTAAEIGASQAVTIGAGGAGGLSTPATGSVGGNSAFGGYLSCNGGGGGAHMTTTSTVAGASGAIGGAYTTGAGITGVYGSPGNYGTANSSWGFSGHGGDSHFGTGGLSIVAATSATAGYAGNNYGAGGGGAATSNLAASSRAGGDGAPGVVIVTEFIQS